jgi:hypothetical protein
MQKQAQASSNQRETTWSFRLTLGWKNKEWKEKQRGNETTWDQVVWLQHWSPPSAGGPPMALARMWARLVSGWAGGIFIRGMILCVSHGS